MMAKNKSLVPLGKVRVNTRAVVNSIPGNKKFVTKAIGMGITIGSEVFVVRNHKMGPVIIFLRDSSIALGRKEAGDILVEVSGAL